MTRGRVHLKITVLLDQSDHSRHKLSPLGGLNPPVAEHGGHDMNFRMRFVV
jgi:hypothetical protein